VRRRLGTSELGLTIERDRKRERDRERREKKREREERKRERERERDTGRFPDKGRRDEDNRIAPLGIPMAYSAESSFREKRL